MSDKYSFGAKSQQRLIGVHPSLVQVVTRGIAYSSFDFTISEGVRTLDRQKQLVAQGASMTLNSKHLVQPDGFGHAVDLVATGDLDGDKDVDAQDQALVWNPAIYKSIAEAMQKAADELGVGIRWGGTFKKRNGQPFFDGPHFELT